VSDSIALETNLLESNQEQQDLSELPYCVKCMSVSAPEKNRTVSNAYFAISIEVFLDMERYKKYTPADANS